MIDLFNIDCMEYMAGIEDNAFDLAIVDPPYGIGRDGQRLSKHNASNSRHGGHKYFERKGWDLSAPNKGYFVELFRVSHNQIIWGANYYPQFLKPSMGWVFWDKMQRGFNSDGELAYTSFNTAMKVVQYQRGILAAEGTIHPTQKPIKLYEWLLSNYAKEGDRILDTHLGSGSSAIAAHYGGFDFVGCELDPDYYTAAVDRFNNETRQAAMF
jgi:site-specific DNA-methyltransferase (adenine-specific)